MGFGSLSEGICMSRILLVDDEKNVLTTLSIGLRRNKFIVRQAQSGPEALKIMEKYPCDILVSDVRMRPMDGYILASRVRRNYPDVGIVLMSAYGFRDGSETRVESLDCPQLIKPFTVRELVRVLREEEQRGKDDKNKNNIIRNNRRFLFFGEKGKVVEIHKTMETSGFCVECLTSQRDLEKKIKKVVYDLFLIDVDFLDGQQWKILNVIDQQEPGKPVILLVRKKGDKKVFSTPDLAVTVLDRDMFFQNPSWAVAALKKSLDGDGAGGENAS